MAPLIVVDDDERILRLLREWLSTWGFDVRLASGAEQALDQMESEPAPIVLCDVMMPGRDGVWLAEQIRERWPRTAVIMATGVHNMETVERTQQLGAVDYVTKPFGREMLVQALQRAEAWSERH